MRRGIKHFLCWLIILLCSGSFLSCRPFLAGGIYHEVKPGHTLFAIAQTYNTTVSDIQKANNLSGATIFPGQKLFIPRALRTRYVHPTIGGRVHIRQRTSLESLARRYNMSEDYLHRANRYPFWKGSVRNEDVFIPGLVSASAVPSTPSAPTPRRPSSATPSRLPFSLIWPVEGRITSTFQSRDRPDHSGMDIAAPQGTPIKAAAPGKIVYSDNRISGYGNMVIIRHESGYFTVYAHNQRNTVKPGQEVRQGQVIGYVGMTGRATGPHLHFELRHEDTPLDPQDYLPKR